MSEQEQQGADDKREAPADNAAAVQPDEGEKDRAGSKSRPSKIKKRLKRKGPRGQAKVALDLNVVRQCGYADLSPEGAARVLQCDPKTVRKRLAEEEKFRLAFEEGKASRKDKIRQELFKLVDKGNLAAVIFASKAILGLNEVMQVEHTVNISSEAEKLARKFNITLEEAEDRLKAALESGDR